MQLNWKPMRFTCKCGTVAKLLTHVGISSNNEVVVQWKCLGCGATPIALQTVDNLLANAPTTDTKEAEKAKDNKFLSELGIKL